MLYNVLVETDLTPQRIQRSARHIIQSADANEAVSEWRRALTTCDRSQLLPLLYVANEALQNVKRSSRARDFLEAFATILPSSMRDICSRDQSIVEKVRRTIKIWGDRRVYSARFVAEILASCDAFRNNGSQSIPTTGSAYKSKPSVTPDASVAKDESGFDKQDDVFGDPKSKLLKIDVEVGPSVVQKRKRVVENDEATKTDFDFGSDDKSETELDQDILPGTISGSSHSNLFGGPKSIKSLTALLAKLVSIKSRSSVAASFPQNIFDTKDASNLVGDELSDQHTKLVEADAMLKEKREKIYQIAGEKHEIERELVGFIDWLKEDIETGEKDIARCDELDNEINLISTLHGKVRAVREKKIKVEAEQREAEALEAKREQQKQEDLERKKDLEEQLAKNKEAGPGMVWNAATREFQSVHDHTEDSW
eukprot:CAMPEP_0116013320 /NCGR_PEP_ID=MMETSP0321-20121206/5660_1 /TAXON_ID=163516 /ORGANISM="Leptocylindrus danicus var. danicus, Strain B650" /LENGTH=424 /DNA_ID=CAMNT_0003482855 /DNA_START=147 /DNA_END=1418 /DNA_ORIENTATION=+